MTPIRLDALTTFALADAIAKNPPIVLLPVGSVEPHGPHLPLSTDSFISETASERAAVVLRERGFPCFVAPTIPYGVTDYAAGFAGAISVDEASLVGFLRAVIGGFLRGGIRHVSVINNHLEPAHDLAVRKATADWEKGRVSLACPLSKRWGRTLSDEFKSGACHGGEYETSLVLARDRSLVGPRDTLPALALSLSEAIRAGKKTFREIGMDQAYTGAPASATAEEGERLYERLVTMITTEVEEALATA